MVISSQAPGPPVEHPQANLVMILGVLSLACCGLTGPMAWALGKRALDQIENSGGGYGGRVQVLLGFVLGVIGTIMMIAGATLLLLLILGGG